MEPKGLPEADRAFCTELMQACMCTGLRKASRAVTQAYDQILEPCGLRSTQLVTLLEIGKDGPASIAHLARELVMDTSTMARTLKPLEDQGLIDRVTIGGSRRKMIALSDAGRQALDNAMAHWTAAQDAIVGQFTETEFEALSALLQKAVLAARAR